MQVNSDWSRSGTAAELEEYLKEWSYKGPGWYLSDTDTLLLVPVEPYLTLGATSPSLWLAPKYWEPEQVFRLYVWNCDIDNTVHGQPPATIRKDVRGGPYV